MNAPINIREWPAKFWEGTDSSEVGLATSYAGLGEMDQLELAEDDLEIRLWTMGGVSGDKCQIIRRTGSNWTWNILTPSNEYDPSQFREIPEWFKFGQELLEAGFFTMDEPDLEWSIDHNTTLEWFIAVQAKLGKRIRSLRYGKGQVDGPAAEICQLLERYRL